MNTIAPDCSGGIPRTELHDPVGRFGHGTANAEAFHPPATAWVLGLAIARLAAAESPSLHVDPTARLHARPTSGRSEYSRKGCRPSAAWRLEWNNSRLHTPERRKTGLAHLGHRARLTDCQPPRGLLKDVPPRD
ncbi:hypothetical protein E7744_15285 (plasmid) [Citricoccus sp. SGAir0253]|nr:hypothetical protein E7744_15285 [Citricoccus sp. SGAir0253]